MPVSPVSSPLPLLYQSLNRLNCLQFSKRKGIPLQAMLTFPFFRPSRCFWAVLAIFSVRSFTHFSTCLLALLSEMLLKLDWQKVTNELLVTSFFRSFSSLFLLFYLQDFMLLNKESLREEWRQTFQAKDYAINKGGCHRIKGDSEKIFGAGDKLSIEYKGNGEESILVLDCWKSLWGHVKEFRQYSTVTQDSFLKLLEKNNTRYKVSIIIYCVSDKVTRASLCFCISHRQSR